jgi:hypothetical protein
MAASNHTTSAASGPPTYASLDASRASLDASRASLDASRASLDASRASLDASRASLDASRASLDAVYNIQSQRTSSHARDRMGGPRRDQPGQPSSSRKE